MDIVNSFEIQNERFYFFDITKVINENKRLKKLPIVLKILLEANLRNAKDNTEFNNILNIFTNRLHSEIGFFPSRIVMKEFTGMPSLVDLASMRDEVKSKDGNISKINPQIMLDLIIDPRLNSNKEYEKNIEKYQFIKWASNTFSNLRVIPPGSGVYHQVNLECLSTILHVQKKDDKFFLYPETIVGTDFNSNMINSMGVLEWGIDGIQAEAVILGLPISLNLPKVVGVNISGELKEGISSSDLVLILKNKLIECNIEGKLVEFYGNGLKFLTLEDRSNISNMAPEYKAICSFFAIDDKTINYFNETRENKDYGNLIKTYLQKQSLFYDENEILDYDETISIDLSSVKPVILGLKNLQDSIDIDSLKSLPILNEGKILKDGDVVLSKLSSCNSVSNAYLLIFAAIVAKKASSFGMKIDKNIKALLVFSSYEEKKYLEELDLLKYLEEIGFNIIEDASQNLEKLDLKIESDIKINNLNVVSISSNSLDTQEKNHLLVKSNYKTSASLLIIYSLIGTMKFDIFNDVITCIDEKEIRLKDLWPTNFELTQYLKKLDNSLYKDIYKEIFKGDDFWQNLKVENSDIFNWNENSTYIQPSRYFEEINLEKIEIKDASILALYGDNILSKDISSQGQISLYSTTSKYLESKGIKSYEYKSFENRRASAEVMIRGAFDNINLDNLIVSKEGGYTFDYDTNEIVSIYEKALKYKKQNKSLVIVAGENYGSGIQVDWVSKATRLLGVKAVIAKSFDHRHRFDLIAMGVLPLEFIDDDIQTLKLKGYEKITITSDEIKADSKISIVIEKSDRNIEIEVKCRLDSEIEIKYYENGGLLSYLMKKIRD